jgi:hypothetical protein
MMLPLEHDRALEKLQVSFAAQFQARP